MQRMALRSSSRVVRSSGSNASEPTSAHLDRMDSREVERKRRWRKKGAEWRLSFCSHAASESCAVAGSVTYSSTLGLNTHARTGSRTVWFELRRAEQWKAIASKVQLARGTDDWKKRESKKIGTDFFRKPLSNIYIYISSCQWTLV